MSENNVPEKYLAPYDPQKTEGEIYAEWEKSGYFNPDVCVKEGVCEPDAETFSMVLPPPNATDKLHVGSALMLVIEDIVIRFQRMLGKKTLWLPGTDHAAIATHSKVEKLFYKETGKSRHDIGREAFEKMVDEFVEENRGTIKHQMPAIGASLDWSREAYTLDEKRNTAVHTAFKKMYDEGLIYRGTRVINWDPKGQTAISDDEIVYKDEKTTLYTFKYNKDFPISISTTRPETKVGDTAVAVHPNDKRYKKFLGKEYDVEFAGTELHIKIVPSNEVDPAYGTGALGVTPAHSVIDETIAKEHDLPSIQVINEYAKMTEAAGVLVAGKKTKEARSIIVKWLKENGMLEKEEEIEHNLSTAERTGGTLEPLPKLQWFVDVNKRILNRNNKSLKELMKESVESGAIKILPEQFEKVYFHWIDKLYDWNISRQLWYGHRIPVWYRGEETYVGADAPSGDGWEQDPDTLDTWFSSGLWTFSTLGWPAQTNDLKTFHPTNLIESGYDILFFWIARMILMSQFFLGEVPFRTVYLHGLVRDEQGRKISKSLGNNIDPLDVVQQYGADALRMALMVGVGPGSDSKLSYQKIKAYKNFANKLWNITRFVLDNTKPEDLAKNPPLRDEDKKHIADLEAVLVEITEDITKYRLHLASEKIYHYVWHTFADEILESSKKVLSDGSEAEQASVRWMLRYVLRDSLKALHPFMPFVTEEIWKDLKNEKEKLLMVTRWPTKT
jgi:valyl-tRNA synthetase